MDAVEELDSIAVQMQGILGRFDEEDTGEFAIYYAD